MDFWDIYSARLGRDSGRSRLRDHTKRVLSAKIPDTLSCHEVTIDGIRQTVSVLSRREDMSVKKICALPGQMLRHGGIVDFAGGKWLITDLDADNEIYASGLMHRCNHLLRWLDEAGEIIEKWCVVEDGTKYLIGEKQERMMSIGDARIAVTICKDPDTDKLCRGKRFLIDDADSVRVQAFQITKPNKLYNVFGGKGVFRFILNEVNLTDDDNTELRIADYYSWHPEIRADNEHRNPDIAPETVVAEAERKAAEEPDDGKKVWL